MSSFSEELCEATARMNLAALSALLLIQAPVSSRCVPHRLLFLALQKRMDVGPLEMVSHTHTAHLSL